MPRTFHESELVRDVVVRQGLGHQHSQFGGHRLVLGSDDVPQRRPRGHGSDGGVRDVGLGGEVGARPAGRDVDGDGIEVRIRHEGVVGIGVAYDGRVEQERVEAGDGSRRRTVAGRPRGVDPEVLRDVGPVQVLDRAAQGSVGDLDPGRVGAGGHVGGSEGDAVAAVGVAHAGIDPNLIVPGQHGAGGAVPVMPAERVVDVGVAVAHPDEPLALPVLLALAPADEAAAVDEDHERQVLLDLLVKVYVELEVDPIGAHVRHVPPDGDSPPGTVVGAEGHHVRQLPVVTAVLLGTTAPLLLELLLSIAEEIAPGQLPALRKIPPAHPRAGWSVPLGELAAALDDPEDQPLAGRGLALPEGRERLEGQEGKGGDEGGGTGHHASSLAFVRGRGGGGGGGGQAFSSL